MSSAAAAGTSSARCEPHGEIVLARAALDPDPIGQP